MQSNTQNSGENIKKISRNEAYLELLDTIEPEEFDEIVQGFREDEAIIRDFRLGLGPYEQCEGTFDPRNFNPHEPDLGDLDQAALDWDAMFSCMSGLKTRSVINSSFKSTPPWNSQSCIETMSTPGIPAHAEERRLFLRS